jgi:hypothetical protein
MPRVHSLRDRVSAFNDGLAQRFEDLGRRVAFFIPTSLRRLSLPPLSSLQLYVDVIVFLIVYYRILILGLREKSQNREPISLLELIGPAIVTPSTFWYETLAPMAISFVF